MHSARISLSDLKAANLEKKPRNYLYLDDTGTRNPDWELMDPPVPRDAFGIGGVLIREEDKDAAKASHAAFCKEWGINYPLHSAEIRHRKQKFNWLKSLSPSEDARFHGGLSEMLLSLPLIGHACIVHRPGYDKRYRDEYGGGTWHLCKTAFSVVVERAVKLSIREGRQLVVFPEWGDPTANKKLREYYKELKTNGMPFNEATSAKYKPLTKDDFNSTLFEFALKPKCNPLVQIADLYLYPIRRGGYDLRYRPHEALIERAKLIDCTLEPDDVGTLGIKYSCFEDVERS